MPRIVILLNLVGHRLVAACRRNPQPVLRVLAVALLAAVTIGSVSVGVSAGGSDTPTVQAADVTGGVASRQADVASRSGTRAAAPAAAPSSAATAPAAASTKDAAAAAPKAAATAPAAPAQPAVVAGLSTTQMEHAATIISVGKQMNLPKRAYVVAIATAMQESKLSNLANWNSAASMAIPHDGVGGDWDSVGLFQQRPSSGWGNINELMTPAVSARRFYQALAQVPGWSSLPITVAAQEVQGSAFPDAYADDEPLATQVVDALAK
jgi:hypothetical protein